MGGRFCLRSKIRLLRQGSRSSDGRNRVIYRSFGIILAILH
ncbi:hypothetical protein [Enterocloster phage PMBT24]|uniref:Uncharacterized protein n=1 Tax=Enterocloster phage PMBT24 TaxID=3025413 RepID=A0AAT9TRV9_9CAUD|nr:hypothetical protein [Enterocloster phage PMBT24]DAL90025.1 MAG TPA: hypothetical protein [Caudoviricetes sp.]